MEIPIQARFVALAAAVDYALSDAELTPCLQLRLLEALALAITLRIDRISEEQGGGQAL